MSTTKQKLRQPAATKHEPDWAALDALTDDEIDAQIAANADAAPDVSDWPLEDAFMLVPTDVRAIRARFGLSQEKFAKAFAIKLATLRDWEQERRMPHGPARTLLQIIDREPDAVRRALATKGTPRRSARKRRASLPGPAQQQTARSKPSRERA